MFSRQISVFARSGIGHRQAPSRPAKHIFPLINRDVESPLNQFMRRAQSPDIRVEENIEETLSFYRLPLQHHKNLKSTNMLERLMEEIKRRRSYDATCIAQSCF